MTCPRCGTADASLTSPDYGQGAEFTCYACATYGYRFVSRSREALAASDASKAASAENASAIEEKHRDKA